MTGKVIADRTMYKYNFSFTLVLTFLLIMASLCHADIYKYTDPEGVIHLTNVPTEPNIPYVLVMKEKRWAGSWPGPF